MNNITSEAQIETMAANIRTYMPENVDGDMLDKTIDFTIQSILGRQLSMGAGLLAKQVEQIDKAQVKLMDAFGQNNGSEVSDQRIIRATDWMKIQEAKMDYLSATLEAEMGLGKEAYQAYFGKQWVPYSESKKIAENMTQTAAADEARKLLEAYAEKHAK